MTTAHIYYRPGNPVDPDHILILGRSIEIRASDWDDHNRYTWGAVNVAVGRVGWQIMPDARIVRQADGTGTVRVEPLPAADSPPPNGWPVTITRTGQTYTVAVDGQSMTLPTATVRDADIDDALRLMGYDRNSPITTTGVGAWSCAARPVDTTAYADWRDAPTIVRISEAAAAALTELSTTLGIDGDDLASAWIIRAASDARNRYARFSKPGYIRDPHRIKGWGPEGWPHLDRLPATSRKDT